MEEDESTELSVFPTSKILWFFSDPVVPAQVVNLCISKEVYINTQDTLSIALYLTAPIPNCTVGCMITSPHMAKLWLQLRHHQQIQSCEFFYTSQIRWHPSQVGLIKSVSHLVSFVHPSGKEYSWAKRTNSEQRERGVGQRWYVETIETLQTGRMLIDE